MSLLDKAQKENFEVLTQGIINEFNKLKPLLESINTEAIDIVNSDIKVVKDYYSYALEIIVKSKKENIPTLYIFLSNIETCLALGEWEILKECCQGEPFDVEPELKKLEKGFTRICYYDRKNRLLRSSFYYGENNEGKKENEACANTHGFQFFRKTFRTEKAVFNYFK